MKKLLVVLLALGLLVAFGATASAADVKFAGEYYVVGIYENNPTLNGSVGGKDLGYSRAYFWQRGRLQPVFSIADGLTFTARMDFMEKGWGMSTWRRNAVGGADTTSSRSSAGNVASNAQENFEWERAYVTFMTKAGQFQVGYQAADTWGTVFADSGTTRPRIFYTTAFGPVTGLAIYEKIYEADRGLAGAPSTKVDADGDTYALAGIYKMKAGEAGLLWKYYTYAWNRLAATPYTTKYHLLAPYAKLTFGNVYVEAELDYTFGKAAEYEGVKPAATNSQDVDAKAWGGYILARMNMGPAYFGAQIGYATDNDYDDPTVSKAFSGGSDWNPALIMGSDDLYNWNGGSTPVASPIGGGAQALQTLDNNKTGLTMYNVFGGFNPTPKLNIEAGLTFANTSKKRKSAVGPAGVEFVSSNVGTELDLKATYKIYDTLSYMVGAGYLWAGDFFKGTNAGAVVENDYLLMNKLTLSF